MHVAVNRPDVAPGGIKRPQFRGPLSPRDYTTAKQKAAQTQQRFTYGFLMTYMRDSNYQMFVVSCLSRWWFMLKLIEADWAKYGGPGPSDTVAIIVSGTEGGSAEAVHPGGSTKAYIPKMINLLARTAPFKVQVVPENSEIYADNLWVPGAPEANMRSSVSPTLWTAEASLRLPGVVLQNYLPCALLNVERGVSALSCLLSSRDSSLASKLTQGGFSAPPDQTLVVARFYLCLQYGPPTPPPMQVEEVTRVLKENSLAAFGELLAAGTITAERKAQLDVVRSEKIYIGRLDVVTMKLDGTKRVMQNEADFAQRLQGLGFSVVEAAEYTEEEKAYILETAKVVVLPVGAG